MTAEISDGEAVFLQMLPIMSPILIFDDYKWDPKSVEQYRRPRSALDAFLMLNKYRIEILYIDWQVVVRKIKHNRLHSIGC